MADFCKQCSIKLFGEDFGDFKGITEQADWEAGMACIVLCEGCGGLIQVDPEGSRVGEGVMKI